MVREIFSARKWVSVNEAATALRLSRPVLYGAIRRGELRGHRFGRVLRLDANDLDAWIAKCATAESDLGSVTEEGKTPSEQTTSAESSRP